ncbi:transcription-repair coupling factor [Tepidibacillus sp. HK-1]|uniref:transcription-repair coupling factor n=1 Tax=Tepidibacillus sp. HK-1 TaxID=1883407 RepID=UPI000852F020|nr:transcription-repair coupling factor [Tepidibacillus sp. HK-1]GBF11399.1 transcription-repair-coupling factor [Tepidibacillus sp. HK-1]
MEIILQKFARSKEFQSILSGLNADMKEQLITGLSGSTKQAMIASLFQEVNKTLIVVTHNLLQAQKVYDDLLELVTEKQLYLYPANELTLIDIDAQSPETLAQRIHVLQSLSEGKKGIYIIPYIGLSKFLPPKSSFVDSMISIEIGKIIDLNRLLNNLIFLGYKRTDIVEKQGEFSVRGGIIDIYPLTLENPVRIELFDVEIDSIRTFDIGTQRSIEKLKNVDIPPAREWIATKEEFMKAATRAEEYLSEQLNRIKDSVIKEKLIANVSWEIEQLKENQYFNGFYKYASVLYSQKYTLLDYFEKDSLIVFDEANRMIEVAKQTEKEVNEWKTALLQQGEFLPQLEVYQSYLDIIVGHRKQALYLSLFLRQIPHANPENIINFVSRNMQNFHGQMHLLKGELERWRKSNTSVIFLASDAEGVKRLQRVLDDYGMEVDIVPNTIREISLRPIILQGNLQSGFEMAEIRLAVITEGEIFSQKQRKAKKVSQTANAERIKNYTDLRVGDYVVHVNHGIGRYIGIETLDINGIHKDYLHIKYAGNDKLYVPIDQIDLVQKYVGGEEKEPKIYSLGGTEWTKVKNKVKSSVQDIAEDLIKLYAKRQATKGFSFPKDNEFQHEFEALFPYDETPDQLRSIEEIKQDMENERPMDRLLCGDVGYGKTEVAIRAAFKAAMAGKQVAVLVPTTILAQQHFETFKERFLEYPIKIEVISRFRTKKQQTEVIKGIKDGTVDIVIGTHRLLSKDVQFKDLGLLIVDEEQRFGVKHKEKLKELKTNVDVLTLTATPIPRTLHMSMLGVRDLSVIETPPENRFPVQTYVVEYSAAMVREAIERELARGGQVYFLYNQVKSIQQMADQISMLVPDAKVAVAHGQMSESELERVMLDFLEEEYDVLVSTTIIETGVDIPNVNTLIIYDADKMGLSQLYQLRGRVGRSNRIAYAYFTYQRDKVLSEVAEKRLQAIKEFTELGSGFKIAMRDLAIRGAGNLLGAEQHGFIASVGFDLYSQMLKEAIDDLKGEVKKEEKIEPQIELEVDAYLPTDYITDSMQKIEMYKRFANIRKLEEAQDLEDELLDRFGDIPQPVQNLLAVTRIKTYTYLYRIENIIQKGKEVTMQVHPDQNQIIDGYKLFKIANEFDHRIKLSSGHHIGIKVNLKNLTSEQGIQLIEQFLARYREAFKQEGVLYTHE